MRTKFAFLAAIFIILVFQTTSFAVITNVELSPANPTGGNPFIVTVSGELPDMCWSSAVSWSSISVLGNALTMAIIAQDSYQPGDQCAMAIVPYEATQMAPPLPPGEYVLIIIEYHNSVRMPDPYLHTINFTVGFSQNEVIVPDDFPTIQAGIDAVGDGGSVMVRAGTYTGPGNCNLTFRGKDVKLSSFDGARNTIIDCSAKDGNDYATRAFIFNHGESNDALVEGFSITNATGSSTGGAILCEGASPTIRECTFAANSATYFGGVIFVTDYGAPRIIDCIFAKNETTGYASYAGAVGAWSGSPYIEGCRFTDNYAYGYGGAIFYTHQGDVVVKDSYFRGNKAIHGGAIGHYAVDGEITNCAFIENYASQLGGAFFLQDDCSPVIEGCTFYNNTGGTGGVFFIQERFSGQVSSADISRCLIAFNQGDDAFAVYNGTPTISCTDIYGNTGDWTGYISSMLGVDGNISDDPLFCDTAGLILTISDESPCASSNNTCNTLIGLYDIGCDGEGVPTDTDDNDLVAMKYELDQNYPNPFNPTTRISYTIPQASQVTLRVFNVLGQLISTLVNDYQQAGIYEIAWDGIDDEGNAVASGVYLYTLVAGDKAITKRMVFMK